MVTNHLLLLFLSFFCLYHNTFSFTFRSPCLPIALGLVNVNEFFIRFPSERRSWVFSHTHEVEEQTDVVLSVKCPSQSAIQSVLGEKFVLHRFALSFVLDCSVRGRLEIAGFFSSRLKKREKGGRGRKAPTDHTLPLNTGPEGSPKSRIQFT